MPGLRFNLMQNEPDLNGWAVDKEGKLIDELFAIGEVVEFGDERYYGYNALEGTFLGRCLFSGPNAGQTAKDK